MRRFKFVKRNRKAKQELRRQDLFSATIDSPQGSKHGINPYAPPIESSALWHDLDSLNELRKLLKNKNPALREHAAKQLKNHVQKNGDPNKKTREIAVKAANILLLSRSKESQSVLKEIGITEEDAGYWKEFFIRRMRNVSLQNAITVGLGMSLLNYIVKHIQSTSQYFPNVPNNALVAGVFGFGVCIASFFVIDALKTEMDLLVISRTKDLLMKSSPE